MESVIFLKQQYTAMHNMLNEKQWRNYLGLEAKRLDSISYVSKISGASRTTIRTGLKEVENDEFYEEGDRIRKPGGGRKKLSDTDPSLIEDIESLTQPKGDPMSFLKYTTFSVVNLTETLNRKNHKIKKSALFNLLNDLGYSLKPNKKNIEGKSHPDRDDQFKHINQTCCIFEEKGNPIISIDCKKKE